MKDLENEKNLAATASIIRLTLHYAVSDRTDA
jgi:hypothetical protein